MSTRQSTDPYAKYYSNRSARRHASQSPSDLSRGVHSAAVESAAAISVPSSGGSEAEAAPASRSQPAATAIDASDDGVAAPDDDMRVPDEKSSATAAAAERLPVQLHVPPPASSTISGIDRAFQLFLAGGLALTQLMAPEALPNGLVLALSATDTTSSQSHTAVVRVDRASLPEVVTSVTKMFASTADSSVAESHNLTRDSAASAPFRLHEASQSSAADSNGLLRRRRAASTSRRKTNVEMSPVMASIAAAVEANGSLDSDASVSFNSASSTIAATAAIRTHSSTIWRGKWTRGAKLQRASNFGRRDSITAESFSHISQSSNSAESQSDTEAPIIRLETTLRVRNGDGSAHAAGSILGQFAEAAVAASSSTTLSTDLCSPSFARSARLHSAASLFVHFDLPEAPAHPPLLPRSGRSSLHTVSLPSDAASSSGEVKHAVNGRVRTVAPSSASLRNEGEDLIIVRRSSSSAASLEAANDARLSTLSANILCGSLAKDFRVTTAEVSSALSVGKQLLSFQLELNRKYGPVNELLNSQVVPSLQHSGTHNSEGGSGIVLSEICTLGAKGMCVSASVLDAVATLILRGRGDSAGSAHHIRARRNASELSNSNVPVTAGQPVLNTSAAAGSSPASAPLPLLQPESTTYDPSSESASSPASLAAPSDPIHPIALPDVCPAASSPGSAIGCGGARRDLRVQSVSAHIWRHLANSLTSSNDYNDMHMKTLYDEAAGQRQFFVNYSEVGVICSFLADDEYQLCIDVAVDIVEKRMHAWGSSFDENGDRTRRLESLMHCFLAWLHEDSKRRHTDNAASPVLNTDGWCARVHTCVQPRQTNDSAMFAFANRLALLTASPNSFDLLDADSLRNRVTSALFSVRPGLIRGVLTRGEELLAQLRE